MITVDWGTGIFNFRNTFINSLIASGYFSLNSTVSNRGIEIVTPEYIINQNHIKMKQVKQFIGAAALTAFLAFTSPVVMAQTTDNTTTTTTTDDMDDDEDDDTGKWGLAGLLGLLGLAGLKRRDDDRTHTNTNVNR